MLVPGSAQPASAGRYTVGMGEIQNNGHSGVSGCLRTGGVAPGPLCRLEIGIEIWFLRSVQLEINLMRCLDAR